MLQPPALPEAREAPADSADYDAEARVAGRRRHETEWREALCTVDEEALRDWWTSTCLDWTCNSLRLEGCDLSDGEMHDILIHRRTPDRSVSTSDLDLCRGHYRAACVLPGWQGRRLGLDEMASLHDMLGVRPAIDNSILDSCIGGLDMFISRFRIESGLRAFADGPRAHFFGICDPVAMFAAHIAGFHALGEHGPYRRHSGLVGRWLVNWVCLNLHYPPLVVPATAADAYDRAVAQAAANPDDADALRPLCNLLADTLDRTMVRFRDMARGRLRPPAAVTDNPDFRGAVWFLPNFGR